MPLRPSLAVPKSTCGHSIFYAEPRPTWSQLPVRGYRATGLQGMALDAGNRGKAAHTALHGR